MLLCLVKAPRYLRGLNFCGCGHDAVVRAGGVADKTGNGRSGWRASSYEVTPSRSDGPRDGGRIVRRRARMRQPIIGPGRPRECVSARGGAQVGVDLMGT